METTTEKTTVSVNTPVKAMPLTPHIVLHGAATLQRRQLRQRPVTKARITRAILMKTSRVSSECAAVVGWLVVVREDMVTWDTGGRWHAVGAMRDIGTPQGGQYCSLSSATPGDLALYAYQN